MEGVLSVFTDLGPWYCQSIDLATKQWKRKFVCLMISHVALSLGRRQAFNVSRPHDLAANMALVSLVFRNTSRTTMAVWSIPNRKLNCWCLELNGDLWAPLSGLAVNFGYLAIPPIWREEGLDFRGF